MTKARRIDLVVRYLKGATVPELSKRFGIAETRVVYTLKNIYVRRNPGRHIHAEECVYPGLARWLISHEVNCAWLAERMGVTRQMVGNYLHGKNNITKRRRIQICAITGLTEEQAFGDGKEA